MKLPTLIIFILWLLVFASPALAERRVALVIGNGAYESVPKLTNPTTDAAAVAEELKKAGFEVVLRTDLDQKKMASALSEFTTLLNGADVGLFYYAGHALQYDGDNYLISTNAVLDNPFALNSDAIPLAQIVQTMQTSAKVNLVLLDACRNNPFVERLKQALPGSRSVAVNRGLAPMATDAVDTMIAYATSSNQTAADGAGAHSPFTQALLDNMMTPGLEVSLVMKRVIQEVRDTTLKQQNPEILNKMASEFYFVPPTQVAEVSPVPADNFTAVTDAFRAAMAVGTAESWRQFIGQYPDTSLSEFARQALASVEAKGGPAPLNGAGTVRTTPDIPDTLPVVPDAHPTQEASLPPLHGPTDQPDPTTTPISVTVEPEVLALQIQGELNRIGCTVGEPDGHWGVSSQRGLERYASATGQTVEQLQLTQLLLDKLRAGLAQTCTVQCTASQKVEDNQCVAKTCPSGQRISSKGNCYVPVAATPVKKKKLNPPVIQDDDFDSVPAPKHEYIPPVAPGSLCSLCN